MRHNVLFITYYFPPDASPGSARMSAHVRALARGDWNISVLCSRGLAVGKTDPGRLEGIPEDVEITRTRTLDLYRLFHKSAAPPAEPAPPKATTARRKKRKKLLAPLKWLLYPLYQLSRWPDKQVGWIPHLVWNGYRLIRRKHIDIVFSSSPPHSSQAGVLLLHKLLKFRWITDFRDPWSAPFRYPRHRFSRWIQRKIERWVLRSCDRIIVNTPGNRESLLAGFPEIPGEKVLVVTNGFDTTLPVDDRLETANSVDCDIVYVGEVYQGMLDLPLEALSRLLERNGNGVPHIHIFGTIHQSEWDKITKRGLDRYIHYRGFVSWSQSIRVMREAKSLLLLLSHTPEYRSCVPSKVYPYIFSGRPILALVPRGDAADIVGGSGLGVVVSTQDIDELSAGIEQFVAALRSGQLAPRQDDSFVRQYSIEELAARVDGLMKETLRT